MKTRRPYPAESYQRLYDPAAGPLWSISEGLPPAEDGDHYLPERDFFEWWYFDAALTNGNRLVVILHSSLFNAVDHKPTVDIRLSAPDRTSRMAIGRYDRAEYHAAPDHCDVQIANCRAFAENPHRYRLRLHQDDIAVDLVYESHLPGWRPGTGYLFADDATGHFFKWVVPLPKAQVTGTLSVAGENMEVEGIGYHDHNWGNFALPDAFHHWYWSRLLTRENAVIFGDVVGHGTQPRHVTPLLVIAGKDILAEEAKVSLQTRGMLIEPITEASYPTCLDVSVITPNFQISGSLHTRQVLEAVGFASPPFRQRWPRQIAEIAFYILKDRPFLRKLTHRLLGKASYLRLQANATLNIHGVDIGCLIGDAIYEIMYFHT
jgi:hypothetical protein